jgi:hypothetical protein
MTLPNKKTTGLVPVVQVLVKYSMFRLVGQLLNHAEHVF